MKYLRSLKKYGTVPVATGLVALSSFPAFASEAVAVGPDAWSSVISAMTGQISVTTIVAVIASTVAAGIGLVFMWWGVRKAASALMSAFRKGRLSV